MASGDIENINKNDLDLLSPAKGDVYLVAYPKAGVTWMTEIVTAIYREYAIENKNVSTEFEKAVRAHAFCEVCPMARRRTTQNNKNQKNIIGFDANGSEVYESDDEKRRRIISLHFPLKRMEKLMPEAFSNKWVKLIYVARNPKDIAVSYYHFHRMNEALPTPESWEQFLDDFVNGTVRWGSCLEHIREWNRKLHELKATGNRHHMLWLTFESLKKDLRGEMRRICDHLKLNLSDKGLSNAVNRCTFASMKADPNRNHSKNTIFKGDFLRKGKVGDWKSKFTVEQNINFNKVILRELGGNFRHLEIADEGNL